MQDILIVIESDWAENINFIEFGLSEAFGTGLHATCTIRYEVRRWDQLSVDRAIDEFVVRADRYQRIHALPERYLHLATGEAPLILGGSRRIFYFVVIAIFKRNRMVAMSIEPLIEINPVLDRFIDERMAHIESILPSTRIRGKLLREVSDLIRTVVQGFEIAQALRDWQQGGRELSMIRPPH